MIGQVYKFTIKGKPVTQKNSKQIITIRDSRSRRGWRYSLIDCEAVKKWRKSALEQLIEQRDELGIKSPFDCELAAYIVSFLGKAQRSDADNLATAPLDALQKAEIVINDQRFKTVVSRRERDHEDPRVEVSVFDHHLLRVEVEA